ncbi:MAG: alpha/beta hydrolase [Proteobacteria bacterium]|nr:alpha/beta hydrolase [Pseudomonadota bacterium]
MRRSAPTAVAILCLLSLSLSLCGCAPKTTATPEPATPSVQSVRVGDTMLDYRDLGGTGRPLLLVTGFAATMDMWDPAFVRSLAANHRVILMDNRGMGVSKAPDGPLSINQMARDAIGLLDALGIARADVLGWSMGGCIAQEMALARPNLVASLILYSTMGDSTGILPVLDRMAAMTPAQLQQALFPKAWADAHPDVFARLPARTRPPDMNIIARQYAAIGQWRGALRDLPSLRCPVLLLGGLDDWVTPPERLRQLAQAIPGAQLEMLPQSGHWMMHQYPQQMAWLINAFLTRTALAGSHEPVTHLALPGAGVRAEMAPGA